MGVADQIRISEFFSGNFSWLPIHDLGSGLVDKTTYMEVAAFREQLLLLGEGKAKEASLSGR